MQAKNADSDSYTSARHSRKVGHNLDTDRHLVVYRSNSKAHRLMVETSLISLCHTIEGNTASSSTKDMNIIGPMILKGAPLIWKDLIKVESLGLDPQLVPRKYRPFFSQRIREPSLVDNTPRTQPIMPSHSMVRRSQVT